MAHSARAGARRRRGRAEICIVMMSPTVSPPAERQRSQSTCPTLCQRHPDPQSPCAQELLITVLTDCGRKAARLWQGLYRRCRERRASDLIGQLTAAIAAKAEQNYGAGVVPAPRRLSDRPQSRRCLAPTRSSGRRLLGRRSHLRRNVRQPLALGQNRLFVNLLHDSLYPERSTTPQIGRACATLSIRLGRFGGILLHFGKYIERRSYAGGRSWRHALGKCGGNDLPRLARQKTQTPPVIGTIEGWPSSLRPRS